MHSVKAFIEFKYVPNVVGLILGCDHLRTASEVYVQKKVKLESVSGAHLPHQARDFH